MSITAEVPSITLGPVSDSSHQPEVFYEALAAFANKLGVECPDAEITLADPDAVVLVIHAAALLAVLDHSLHRRVNPGWDRHRYRQLSMGSRGEVGMRTSMR